MLYENGLFIFRRDLRIVDNIGLNYTNSICKRIYPCFIFTPEQVGKTNPYKSNNAVQFMIESLMNLDSEIHKQGGGKLLCFYSSNLKAVKECIRNLNIEYVCFNLDYSPYALERDNAIAGLCFSLGIRCEFAQDYYLNEPGSILNGSGAPYQKFTPYYETALRTRHNIIHPTSATKIKFASIKKTHCHTISIYLMQWNSLQKRIQIYLYTEVALKQLKHYTMP